MIMMATQPVFVLSNDQAIHLKKPSTRSSSSYCELKILLNLYAVVPSFFGTHFLI